VENYSTKWLIHCENNQALSVYNSNNENILNNKNDAGKVADDFAKTICKKSIEKSINEENLQSPPDLNNTFSTPYNDKIKRVKK